MRSIKPQWPHPYRTEMQICWGCMGWAEAQWLFGCNCWWPNEGSARSGRLCRFRRITCPKMSSPWPTTDLRLKPYHLIFQKGIWIYRVRVLYYLAICQNSRLDHWICNNHMVCLIHVVQILNKPVPLLSRISIDHLTVGQWGYAGVHEFNIIVLHKLLIAHPRINMFTPLCKIYNIRPWQILYGNLRMRTSSCHSSIRSFCAVISPVGSITRLFNFLSSSVFTTIPSDRSSQNNSI